MDISSLLEVQVNEGRASPELGSSDSADQKPKNFIQYRPSEIVTPEESKFYRRMIGNDVAQVRFRRLHCTACDEHIGSAPIDAYNMQEHPMLKTLLCAHCREFYGDGDFEQGEDATDMFCRWCANGGNLYCCSYCCNTFCDKCIKRNFDAEVRERIEEDEKWRCFVCDPKDLYTLRGVCRALLLHVKTVTRILKSNPTMSQKDIENKMEQDDSKCCVGKRSTRRKRSISSSGSLNDDIDQGSSAKKSKVKNGSNKNRKSTSKDHNYTNKPMQVISNGNTRFLSSTRFLPAEPSPPAHISDKDEIPAPLLHFEQTMIEGDGQVLPNQPNAKIPDSILNNSAISLNPIPKNLFRGPPGNIINLRPIRLDSVPPGATLHRLARIPTRPNAPMVTIPGRSVPITTANVNQTPKTFLRCKNLTAIPTVALTTPNSTTPSVIDIDSDPEELPVTNNTTESSKAQQTSAGQTVKVINPVALTNAGLEDRSPIMSLDNPRRKIFDDVIYNPIKEVDKLITKIRGKLRTELKKAAGNLADNEAHNARVRLATINRCIYQAVDELSAFNNTMIQQYRPWKESLITGDPIDDNTNKIVMKKGERSIKYTPFDMDCESESDSDNEVDEVDDVDVEQLIDFTGKVKHFIEKDTINRSTNTEIQTKSQGVQVEELIETKDYDRTIGYSLLMRTDYDFEKRKEIHKPTKIHDHNFGKYEEQFIFYLQHLENQGEDEDTDDVVEKVPLTDLIDKDIARQEKTIEEDCDRSPRLDEVSEKEKENDVDVDVVDLEEPVGDKTPVNIIAEEEPGVEESEKNSDDTRVDTSSQDDIDVVNVSGEAMNVDRPSEPSLETLNDCNGDKDISNTNEIDEENLNIEVTNHKSPEPLNNNSSIELDDVPGVSPAKSLNDSRENNEDKLTASQEAKHEETVIAVKTLIEENNSVDQLDRWRNNDEEDECMVLD
ncbi:uncharacterized protein LOC123261970 [Cotesia glomerata]|uniref:PHD-type domain-containing protein n=1 Tax=Cotesia glomerata TaxID=32391 RepID=A0AAV7HZV1_COTGL|nr:uncharacterized protein LOC123261970 [Cotesia glomerata]KAH0550623.1 hypothetical protein KQX54_020330 [Cotesia glomerata]